LFGELGLATQQELPLRAAVDVSRRVVDELVLSEKQCPAIEIGQGKYVRMPASSTPTMFSIVP
jgi:hypothetical protein